ncbi:helix-turn-helix transcriptional regulator [Cyclobacterium marinum]|uniref:helix-turn-helix transcriptional regulator n=1 Tax=Cyclobacterium marinum TaxID=104 RepID=UPI0011EE0621|nr:helix-turn-helix transcriptional regulator [Cyclobacterium marinum]MBI0401696.1 helix-turn-helix transcriptional regulator [Cyclobacterium marinum]
MNSGDHSIALLLSRFVKEKRKDLGLTQKELADKAGVGLRFVRELERDKPSLQMDKVNQVLVLFGFELGPVPMNRNNLIHEKG